MTVIFRKTYEVALSPALSGRLCTDDLHDFGRDVLLYDDESKLVVIRTGFVDAASHHVATRVFNGKLVESLFDSMYHAKRNGSIASGS
ncbi:unnamed protein product [Alternaria sp. RS040]